MRLGLKILQLRKQKGMSQEQLALEIGVSRQAVSKWESEQAVPDLDKVIALSSFFGVCTDYLLKDEMEIPTSSVTGENLWETGTYQTDGIGTASANSYMNAGTQVTGGNTLKSSIPCKTISDEEVNDYIEVRKKASNRIAVGVVLCILSVVPPVIIDSLGEHMQKFENYGAVLMLLIVAVAVALFVVSGIALAKYGYMQKQILLLRDETLQKLEEESDAFQKVFGVRIAVGAVLCILSTIPVIVAADVLTELEEAGVVCLFIMVATGVYQFVKYGIIRGTYSTLLQKEEYSTYKKMSRKHKLMGQIAAVYWCITTAIFLAYSFITSRWDYSWIIWPVAGVLYGAVAAICNLLIKDDEVR